jgi:subtilisin family serine protease
MTGQFALWVAPVVLLALAASGPGAAREGGPGGGDPAGASRAQERLDRETQRAAERADKDAVRYAEERARIEERAAKDPVKAAEDLGKLDADAAEWQAKAAEDAVKDQADYDREIAREAEDAAEAAVRGEDRAVGSSEEIHDLGSSEGAEHDGDGYPVRKGELVVLDLAPAKLGQAQAEGFRVIERTPMPELGRELIRLAGPQGMTAEKARQALAAIDPEAAIDLVHYYGLNLTAGERPRPVRSGRIAGNGKAGGAIAMIDTGVSSHSALARSKLVAWDAGNLAGLPQAHGTAVASILAAQGGQTIYSANIFRGSAERPFTSADVIAQALGWAIARDAPVINMSLAGPRNVVLDRLIRDALAKGRLVVAAAGNGGPTAPPSYPAAVAGVVAVTAVDQRLHIYRYAQHGHHITVAAQGVDVLAAAAGGDLARFTGTSFATPFVAAWLGRCRAQGGSAIKCKAGLKEAARDLGTAGFDETYGYGYIG